MEIYLTDTVTGVRKQFPIAPDRLKITAAGRFQEYDIMSLGEVMIANGDKLTRFSWSGLLPGKLREREPYVQQWIDPAEMQSFWSIMRNSAHKGKLMATDSPINHAVYLVNYTTEPTGGMGDYEYTIEFVVARDLIVEIEGKEGKQTETAAKKSTDRPETKKDNEYVVKDKDTLWRIAQQKLGNGNRYPEIAKLNNLTNPNLIRVGQVLKLP